MGRAASAAVAAVLGLAVLLVPGTASAHTVRPAEPTGLHVVDVTSDSITVALNKTAHAMRYRLYASTVRSDLRVINISQAARSPLAKSPQISLAGLSRSSTPYYYRVQALNGSRSKFSATIGEVGLRPAAPSHLRAASSPAKTFVTWTPTDATGYVIEQATNRAMTANRKVYSVLGATNQFTPYSLHKGTTYYFRVRSLNASTPSTYSAVSSATARSSHQHVRVMTYNVKEAHFDGTMESGNRVAPWSSERKAGAVALIHRADPDVIGIEEAATAIGHSGGPRQVDTLKRALGGEYGLARTEVPPGHLDTHRTGDYILFKKSEYRAIGSGGHWALGDRRWAAHQILQNRQSHARFLFVDAHLRQQLGRSNDARRAHETQTLVSRGKALAARHHVPVIYVGDFNSDPFDHHAFDAPSDVMELHHIADSYNVAQHRLRTNYNTANHYLRRPPHVGARIDYVYAPAGIGVLSWKVLLRVRHGEFVGPIPSDHNPVVSDLSIPF